MNNSRFVLLSAKLIFSQSIIFDLSAQCTFTGLNPNYCVNSNTSTLTSTLSGGVFSGPGVIGSVFNPSLAGAGTHTITYGVCQSSYAVSTGTFAPVTATFVTVSTFTDAGGFTNNDDGMSPAIPIGFNFSFFCNTYTTLVIATNGFMTFSQGMTAVYPGQTIPNTANPNNFIAPLWSDLNPGSGGSVSYTTVGTTPNRKFIANYISVPFYGTTIYNTVQVQLHETTNIIEIHSTNIGVPSSSTNYKTMGIENSTGTTGYAVTGRNAVQSWTATNECIRFTPGTSCATSQTTIVSPSTISVSGNFSICTGQTTTLTALSNQTYTWSTTSNSASIVETPATTTTYSVSGTNSFGCVANSAITVTVDQTPTVTAMSTSTTNGSCPNATLALYGGGATSYTWTGGVSNNVPFGPTTSNTYIVTGGNACGTATAAISVSIHPAPAIGLSASQPSICSQQSVALCPTGGVSYTFTPVIPNCAAVYPFTNTTYTVRGSSVLGCTNIATASVQVVTTPVIQPAATSTLLCIGSSATLTAVGASNYSWTPGPFSTSVIVVTPNTTTTYSITKWNANCYDTQFITVQVNQLPLISAIAIPSVVCAGTSATLSAGGGNSYSWSPGSHPSGPSAANITIFPQVNTDYTVAASDGTCINTAVVSMATYTNPIISVSTNTDQICSGQSVTFNISGANSYSYSNIPSTSPSLTNVSSVVQLTNSTSYVITGINQFSCTSTAQQVIVVKPLPNISISRTPTLVCVGFPSTLNATSSSTSAAHQYIWLHNQQNGNISVVNPQTTTIYTVSGTHSVTGCVNEQTVSVAVFEPTFTTTSDTAICNKGSVNLLASGATSFTWTGGQPGIHFITVSPSVTTVFTVSALSQTVNGLKCLSSQTVQVSIYNNPTITATHQRSLVCRNESVQLYAKGAATYTWINASNKQGDTISVSPLQKTTYIVIGTDLFGCRDTANVVVDFSNCPGFEEYEGRLKVSIFPNPNNGAFTIQGAADMELDLLNELGQVIRVIHLNDNNSHSINVNGVAAGVYFLRGKQQELVLTEKVVIQK